MRLKKLFSKTHIILFLLALGMATIIMLAIPHGNSKSYNYELNQPWRYQLLTAQFDIPIVRDSATIQQMQDSINRTFVPFVKRVEDVSERNIADFKRNTENISNPSQREALIAGLQQMYYDGVVSDEIYATLKSDDKKLRTMVNADDNTKAVTIDAGNMRTPTMAHEYLDSIMQKYNVAAKDSAARAALLEVYGQLNRAIRPNIVIDSLSDLKFRNQEYLNVTGATGVIKTGQRIVDRGEIITPQIKTNLDTYTSMQQRAHDGEKRIDYTMLCQGLYVAMLIGLFYCFLILYRPRVFFDVRKMLFLISFITLFIVCVIFAFTHFAYGIYLMPFAMVPIVILIFFDSRTALISLIVTVLVTALVSSNHFAFIVTEMSVGMFAIFSLRQLSKRAQLLRAALVSFVVYCFSFTVCMVITEGSFEGVSARIFGTFAINSVILSFAYILVVVIERVFGFISAVTLVELSDINSPLLTRLAEEAPGTFQHSLQVSALAAEAARAIDANALMVRTGALYHDIGKLESPYFYTENQHGVNPHAGLDPETSARKIVSHVSNGLTLASKYKLPQQIRNFISQHHGRGMARYFYNTAVNASPDGKVDKEPFSYKGPNPQSKEVAIVMMADAVEAAARSLKSHSPKDISDLVDKIIDGQRAEGMFDESPLAFNELNTIKDTFKKRLATIYHTRIAYPEVNADAKGEENSEINKNKES